MVLGPRSPCWQAGETHPSPSDPSGAPVTHATDLPSIIQGGMGIGVTNWRLARVVAQAGQLGVVSGTALDRVCAHRLQEGDAGGHIRRILAGFPLPHLAAEVLNTWYRPEGIPAPGMYRPMPMQSHASSSATLALIVVANYVEVALAKEGHAGLVGINLLEKVQVPNLASLYGAMLAGVDAVLMGAGIPRSIPAALRQLAEHQPAQLSIPADGGGDPIVIRFDPGQFGAAALPTLPVPRFLPVIASVTLAQALVRACPGGVDGFVVEGPTAGGHNAPPRGGGAVYGERDRVDLQRLATFGLPFWLAGGYGRPGGLAAARALGAHGIQVGTAFAFCDESGIAPAWKERVLAAVRAGQVGVTTSTRASPTGFPFKVVPLAGSVGDPDIAAARPRVCNIGLLRQPYRTPSGEIGWRCPAEPEDAYLAKGGDPTELAERICLCNGLMATAGHPLLAADGTLEPPLITAGDDLAELGRFLPPTGGFSAASVLKLLAA